MTSSRQLFLQHLAQTSEFPLMLEVERAEGIYLVTPDKRKIVDLIAGIGVSCLGHNHPAVVSAIIEQAQKHTHVMVYGELVQAPQVQLAKALCDTLPEKLDSVYLVNSGSEAVEGALKLAKRFTGRYKIVSCLHAYHGATHGALSVTGAEWFRQSFRPLLPGVSHVRFGVADDLEQIDTHTAAIIIETVQGEAGVRMADGAYFKALRQRCDETGTLLIMDEIQAGFGRTGKFWAFEHYGIVPDILLSAKGMGGGMPIGAFISSKEIMHSLTHEPILGHITTFGGHPVSAAASLATLKTLQSSNLIGEVERKAELFIEQLSTLKAVKEIRHKGLLMAVEFESFDRLQQIIRKLLDKGILSDWFLFCDNSMRIAPPLTISEEEIEMVCEKVREVVG